MDEESEASDITVKSSADLLTCLNGFKTSLEMKLDVLKSCLKEDLMKSVEDIVSNAVSNAIEREVQKLKIEIRKDMDKLSQRVLEIEKQQTDLSQKQTALKSSQDVLEKQHKSYADGCSCRTYSQPCDKKTYLQ